MNYLQTFESKPPVLPKIQWMKGHEDFGAKFS